MKTLRNLVCFFCISAHFAGAQSLVLQPAQSYCGGQPAYIHFSKSGDFPAGEEFALIQVLLNGTELQLGKTSGDSLAYTPTQSTQAKVKALKSGISSPLVNLNVKTPVSAFLQFEAEPVCTGYTRQITIYTGLQAGDQLTWFLNDSLVSNSPSSIYTATEAGTYTARVSRDGCSYDVGGKAIIRIGEINAPIISSPTVPQLCDGYSLQLSAQTANISNVSLQWFRNGDTLSGNTSGILTASESGEYRVLAQQGNCSKFSNPFNVQIGHLKSGIPQSSPVSAVNSIIQICKSAGISLQVSDYSSRSDITTKWYRNDSLINPGSFSSIFVSTPGIYRYTQEQGECIAYSKPIELAIGNFEVLDLNSSTLPQTCKGKTINLQISSRNSTLIRNIYGLELWKDDSKVQDIPQFFETLKITETGDYYIKGKYGNNECTIYSGIRKVEFAESEVPFKIAGNLRQMYTCEDSLILGNTFNLTTGGPATYQWIRNETEVVSSSKVFYATKSGNYRLKVMVDNACNFISDKVEVTLGSIYAEVTGLSSTFCEGELNQLSVSTGNSEISVANASGSKTDPNNLEVEWQKDGIPYKKGLTVSITQSGVYTANVTSGTCRTTTEDYLITLNKIESSLSPEEDSLFICPAGGKVRLFSNDPLADYKWFKDNIPQAANGQSITVENPGSYSVWMERDGCSGMSKKVSITSKESLPEATISGDKSIIFGQSAFVTIHFTGSGPWTFTFPGGGTFETLLNPYIFEVSPSGTTSYTLESVSNPCGYGTVEGEALISVIILGIENEKERDVLVFPNPTYDRILIKKNDFTEFKLGSAMGSRLMSGDLDQESTELNLSHLPSGIYFLELSNSSHRVVKKVIKR